MKTSKINNLETPTFDELKDFTFTSYVKLLRYLGQIYKIVPFREIPREDIPYLILRHDIDISLPAALKMAEIERDLGIKSTYFVRFSSYLYNLFEGKNVRILRQVSKLGHEIGLHYYPAQYRRYNQDPKKTLEIEIQLLEHFIGKKVYSIARHGLWDRDPFATIKEYINANHPRLRRDMFIHDSDRAWAPLPGLFKLLNDPPRRVQLLTHPENWQENKIDREALLERFFRNQQNKNLAWKKRLKEIWLTDPSVIEYDALTEKGEIMRFQHREDVLDAKKQGEWRQALNYYDEVFRWYVINTTFGWTIFHRLRMMTQNRLGTP